MNSKIEKINWNDIKDKALHYRINEEEYQRICNQLGRPPQGIEWALYSALWSEHCSYKSSRVHLRKFASTLNEKILNAQGENAGVLDLGHQERVVFKMESHNHPSFIEPFQGAATGVGGILRDIFTMGARPIALADYLCFGGAEENFGNFERRSQLVDGVVRGISGYGNCVGVPTVTGKTYFEKEYEQNILVNAFALGLLKGEERVALSQAKGQGNLVVYVGAKTGKDGVHGASMASESFDGNSEAKRPNVQIGDPYYEKLLIESCLEVLQARLVVAIQDMGAAGLTSSSFEMASKGQVGMDLFLDRIPLRDSTMSPEEILLSESQERMLLICEPKNFNKIKEIFEKWGLDAVEVGSITDTKTIKLYWKGEVLTEINPDFLVEDAPQYQRPYSEWTFPHCMGSVDAFYDQYLPLNSSIDSFDRLNVSTLDKKIRRTLGSLIGTSRKPIYRQYDQRVGLRTVRSAGDGEDVAFMQLPDSKRAIAIALGGRPFWMKLDAYIGALDAVLYPALQMAIKGAKLEGLTDCLNFGNPEKKEIMTEFVASVDAITEVSQIFRAPVLSGNVSFYNETLGNNIISTPAIGALGLRPNCHSIPKDSFQKPQSKVYSISMESLIADFQKMKYYGKLNVQDLLRFQQMLIELSNDETVLSTQMVGRDGLLYSLIKMCLTTDYNTNESSHLSFQVHTSKELIQKLQLESQGDIRVLYQSIWEVNENSSEASRTQNISESDSFISKFQNLTKKWDLEKQVKILELGQTQIPISQNGASPTDAKFSIGNEVWKLKDYSDLFHNGMGRIIGILA